LADEIVVNSDLGRGGPGWPARQLSTAPSFRRDVSLHTAADAPSTLSSRLLRLKSAVDAVDSLTVQGQYLVKSTQLHAFEVGTLIGQSLENALIQANLMVDLAALGTTPPCSQSSAGVSPSPTLSATIVPAPWRPPQPVPA